MRLGATQWAGVFILLSVILSIAGYSQNDDWIRMPESNSIRHTGFISTPNKIYTPVQTIQSVQRYSPQHAPLYYIILSAWYQSTNIHPLILRILSLYFALLTASFTYRMGRYVDHKWGGLIALFLITFSAYHVFYAHEIRNYTMLAFSSILVMWAYWRIVSVKNKVNNSKWLWLYIASVWCVYTHYFGIFVLLGIGIYHLLFFPKNRRWLQVVGVEVLAGLTFLPWLPIALTGLTSNSVAIISSTSLNLFEITYQHFFIFGNGLWWLTLTLIGIAIWRVWTLKGQSTIQGYMLIVGIVMLIAMVGINEIAPLLPVRRMRYTMVWLPQITLMITIGIVALSKYRWLQGLIIIIWGVGFIWINQTPEMLDYTNISYQKGHKYANYQVIVDMGDSLPGEGETIVTANHDVWVYPAILDYYETLTGRSFLHLTDDFSDFDVDMRQFLINRMEAVMRSYSFWVLTTPQYTDLETVELFQITVPESFRSCLTYIDTATVYLAYYLRVDVPCELVSAPDLPLIEYDNATRLLNAEFEQQGDNLVIYTWWDNKPLEPYGFSVQLFDVDNNKVAQGDFFLPPETIQVSYLDISILPSSDYNVSLVLYELETVTSLSGTNNMTEESFERIIQLDTVSLTK